jgi:uncharacterized membrane protein
LRARALLQTSGRAALAALLAAEAAFVIYLLGTYGRTSWTGNVEAWAEFGDNGWVPGDTAGNIAMALHVGFALVVILAGAIQLLPAVRRRAPALHRWSGRIYLSGCAIAAVSGLALVWGRDNVGDLSQDAAISLNALVLVACGAMAWRTARARAFDAHRAWAIRTFLAANGVLFFRMFIALWLLAWRRPVGFDPETFSGPFLTALAFTVYVVGPLAVFEVYRRAERGEGTAQRTAVAGLLFALAGVFIAGAAAALLVLWFPNLRA